MFPLDFSFAFFSPHRPHKRKWNNKWWYFSLVFLFVLCVVPWIDEDRDNTVAGRHWSAPLFVLTKDGRMFVYYRKKGAGPNSPFFSRLPLRAFDPKPIGQWQFLGLITAPKTSSGRYYNNFIKAGRRIYFFWLCSVRYSVWRDSKHTQRERERERKPVCVFYRCWLTKRLESVITAASSFPSVKHSKNACAQSHLWPSLSSSNFISSLSTVSNKWKHVCCLYSRLELQLNNTIFLFLLHSCRSQFHTQKTQRNEDRNRQTEQ